MESSVRGTQADPIVTLTSGTFEQQILQGKGPLVVEFMSYGCSHCGVLEPILQQVAAMVESKVKIFRVNTEVEQALAESYGVHTTPTLLMFLNGSKVGEIDGPSPTVSSLLTAMAQPFRDLK